MNTIMRQVICIIALLITSSLTLLAQQGDAPARKNTVKVDLTSYWLYRNALTFSYERVVKNRPNQTWSITAGLQQFPKLLGTLSDTILIKRQYKSSGYKLGGEYRFYLKKENKYPAPRGVYIGPYVSYHNYMNGRDIEVNNNGSMQTGHLETDLDILNIGFQLGYQFVINDRWTIDMVFIGPSISNYKFKAQVDGNFTIDPDNITNEVVLDLMDKFPGFKDLLTEGEFVSQGKANKWAYGYRYQLQIGYHFGKKKK
jgi:hypothetical protein